MTNQEVADLARWVYGAAKGGHDNRVTAVMLALEKAGVTDVRAEQAGDSTILVRRSDEGGSTPLCQLSGARRFDAAISPRISDEGDVWPRRIREWRVRHRWTQKELAARLRRLDPCCGCDNGTVSRWERGTHRPSPLHEHLLCAVFEDMVLDGVEVPSEERLVYVRRALALDPAQRCPAVPIPAHAEIRLTPFTGDHSWKATDSTRVRGA